MTQTVRSSHYKRFTTILILLCLLAAACFPGQTPTPRTATEVAQVPTDTPIPPTDTPPPPTDTPVPPTDAPTPVPSATTPPASPSPSASPAYASEALAEHVDESAGYSFRVPNGWVVKQREGVTFVMESGDADVFPEQTPEVFALVNAMWLFDLVDLGVSVDSLAGPTDLLDVSQPFQWLVESLQRYTGSEALVEIGGYPAYAVTTKDGLGRYEYDVLILAQDIGRLAILEAVSSPERWEDALPIFEAIAGSLTLSELQIEKVDPTLDQLELPTTEDLGGEPFVSEEYGYQIAYPEGWLILDDWGQVSFSADVAHSLCEESSGIEWSECHTPIVVALWIPNSDILEEFDSLESESDTLYLLELLAMNQTAGPTYVMRPLETLDVSGVPAIGARFYGSDFAHDEYQSFRGYIIFVRGDTQEAVIWTTTPTVVWQQFQPVFAALLDSFAFVGD
jgi:hypothetical protein